MQYILIGIWPEKSGNNTLRLKIYDNYPLEYLDSTLQGTIFELSINNKKQINMKQLIVLALILITSVLSGQTIAKAPKQAPQAPKSECNCVYPLVDNKESMTYCTGPKGGLYCINKNGGKTYKSSIADKKAK